MMTSSSKKQSQPVEWSERSRQLQEPKTYAERAAALFQLWNDARRAASHDDALFIKIPKNAGTSVYETLRDAGLVKLNTPRMVRMFFRNSGRVTFGHISIGALVDSGLVSRQFVDRAFKFAITRDPYARAASLYRVHLSLMRNWHEQPTFLDFLKWVEKGYYERIGLYSWRGWSQCNPQVEWLRDAWPDKIYRVENLGEFVDDISERWGIPRPEVSHVNRSTADSQVELSRDEKSLVEKIYAEDFETLGYAHR